MANLTFASMMFSLDIGNSSETIMIVHKETPNILCLWIRFCNHRAQLLSQKRCEFELLQPDSHNKGTKDGPVWNKLI